MFFELVRCAMKNILEANQKHMNIKEKLLLRTLSVFTLPYSHKDLRVVVSPATLIL